MFKHSMKNNYKLYVTIFIATLCFLSALISVGFSALNQELNISGDIDYEEEGNTLYSVLKDAANEGTYAQKYTSSHQDSMEGVGTKAIYHWKADNDAEATTILDQWNVIFAGFCWQMIRTTDTGGVKMIYNGAPNNGKCNRKGTAQQIGTSSFNTGTNSMAYAGYMYNPSTLITYKANGAVTSGSLLGKGVSYSGGKYTLTSTSTTYDDNHRYTCNNTTGTCSTVRYYFYNNYYTEISDGRNIEQCVADMLSSDTVNQTNSAIKTIIDNWYTSNMTSYTSKLEDTIFCNDRSIILFGGWNPAVANTSTYLFFKNDTVNGNIDGNLSCTNISDKFSMSNSRAQLTYPVGLLTIPEAYLLNNDNLRKTGSNYWVASPATFSTLVYGSYIFSGGSHSRSAVNYNIGVRPVVSLKIGTKYVSGTGSKDSPYIIE